MVVTALMLFGAASLPARGSDGERPPTDLLTRLDRLAALYRDNALRFTCDEKITYSRPGSRDKVYRFEYSDVYEAPEGLTDYRTRRRAGARPSSSPRAVEFQRYDLPAFPDRAYSWIFIFERAKQDLHRYEILREDRVYGRDALAIGFQPIPPYKKDVNDWFGTAWIDRETFQILRVEALKADQHMEKTLFETHLAQTEPLRERKKVAYTFTQISTEFSVEKNGMRFPGKVTINKWLVSQKCGGWIV